MATKKKVVSKKKVASKKVVSKKTTTRKNAVTNPEVEAAKKAEVEARKAAARAESEARKAAAKAKREKEKAEKEAETARLRVDVEKKLDKTAQDVNARFEAISRAETRADDQRLAAAIMLAEAKDKCREVKINFKEWCESHLKMPARKEGDEPRMLSYETVRKLLPIGAAELEHEG